jgi:replicative DNA helicase
MSEGFQRYGRSFQQKIVQLIISDRYFADQVYDILKPEYLELQYLQLLLKEIFTYKATYESYPNIDTIKTLITVALRDNKDSLEEATKLEVVNFFKKIKDEPNLEDADYIKDEVVKFCKDSEMANAILTSAKILQESNNPSKYDRIRDILDNAMKAGTENNFGTDYLKDFEERYKEEIRNPFTTGWDEIDNITKGGFGKGELVVYIAPTGVGKSFILAHHAVCGAKNGKNVVYYTLELSESDVALRCDAGISGISLDELEVKKTEVYQKIRDIPGKIIIKQYPTNSASTGTIEAHLDKLKLVENFIPNIILVDYGDLLKGSAEPEAYRLGLQKIFENLRAIAIKYECTVITATQTNRTGAAAEIVTANVVSEAFNKCFVADFIFGLSRTMSDKIENKGKLYFIKNRKGKDGILFPCEIDWSMLHMNVLPRAASLEELEGDKEGSQLEKLKKKYLEFKKEKKEELEWTDAE